jgi:transposase
MGKVQFALVFIRARGSKRKHDQRRHQVALRTNPSSLEADKRKAIFLLHEEGMPLREIARRLHVSRNTVAVVIAQGGQLPKLVRAPKQKIDVQLLQRLYEQSGGWIQRMHEKLAEEEGIKVKYSTLTRPPAPVGVPIAGGRLWNAFHNGPFATQTPKPPFCRRK